MADQTSPIQPIEAATNVATRLNENFDAASPAMLYGRDARTTTGLTWGYIGGRFGGALIASGSVTLTASSTSHIVAARADGVVTSLVATTNWDDLTDYIRLYKVTAGASAVTGYEDHRQAIGGAGGGGAIVAADITDSTTVGRAVLTAVDEPAARTAIGAGTSNFSGAYADLTGKPTLGTAAALNVAASGDAAAGEVVRGDDTRLGTGGMTNPMTTAGDLIVGGASGAPTRLGISTNGYVLTLASGVPVWAAASGGGGAWGSITGTLSAQTDLQAALDAKAPLGVITQNSQSTAYTLVLADAGKHILHPSADTTARTFTIPANSSVAFPVGTAVTFINQNGAGVVTIAITSDTMRLAGSGTTGSRTLAANGVATAIKITSTQWIISGAGLT